jgi:MOSC domain-containing protein YiiM/predicted enzyme related to lactoylglutathione lyase
MSDGAVHQINVSSGGVPKRPIDGEGRVTRNGLEGDGHAKPAIHGGPDRALSLYSLERIESLAAQGHPIAPGTVGENVTARGLDWERIGPGTRLRLGSALRIEITSYAAPCTTIAGSFSDGDVSRLSQRVAPGWSRLCARVLREGSVRAGDPIIVESAGRMTSETGDPARVRGEAGRRTTMTRPKIAYVNVFVTDLKRSLEFFERTLGLPIQFSDADFGYASLDGGPIRIGLAQINPGDAQSRALVGRHTGVGFAVSDLVAAHAELEAKGVSFPMKPSKQPWGGFMATFADPDQNVF